MAEYFHIRAVCDALHGIIMREFVTSLGLKLLQVGDLRYYTADIADNVPAILIVPQSAETTSKKQRTLNVMYAVRILLINNISAYRDTRNDLVDDLVAVAEKILDPDNLTLPGERIDANLMPPAVPVTIIDVMPAEQMLLDQVSPDLICGAIDLSEAWRTYSAYQ